jgi:hypothetical protein
LFPNIVDDPALDRCGNIGVRTLGECCTYRSYRPLS